MSDKYVLFVCTGNTCRSPMAAALAKSIFEENNIHAAVYSAGVSAFDGQSASQHAITAMHEEGIDLQQHISMRISAKLLDNAALVFAMTNAHLIAIQSICPHTNAVAFDVSDPFGGDLATYRQTAAEIKEKILSNLEKIREAL